VVQILTFFYEIVDFTKFAVTSLIVGHF